MGDSLAPGRALPLLGQVYRERRTGVLSLGPDEARLRVAVREGQIVGVGPVPAPFPAAEPPRPRLDDSVGLRLEKVLAEIGIRPSGPRPALADARSLGNLRERLLRAVADDDAVATFEEGAEPGADVAAAVGGTEPVILEAVRRLRDTGTVRAALGDLDQRLVATAALAEERTLTLTEGYLLSRIDGTSTVRQILQLAPLDPEETERSLLGLVLTGRVECRPAPAARTVPSPEAPATLGGPPGGAEAGPPESTPSEPAAKEAPPSPVAAGVPDGAPPEASAAATADAAASAPAPGTEMDPALLERRREILEIFQSLPVKNHFEVLGVQPGCSDTEVKRAYVGLAKRFHPDVHRDPRLEDLHDVLEAIFIRVGEAWEVLGDAKSRASYEARFGGARAAASAGPVAPAGAAAGPLRPPGGAAVPAEPAPYVPPEETLLKAQLLLAQARYWDAIQMLEATVPHMQPRRQQSRGRILLARAYAKNPNWVHRAKDTLLEIVNQDPSNADAHYELGLLYKAEGLFARAQAEFRRAVELRPDHREAAAEIGLGGGAPGAPPGSLLKRLFGRGKVS